MNLLRRWEIGPFFRSFSSNRNPLFPQMIERLPSISHARRYHPLIPRLLVYIASPQPGSQGENDRSSTGISAATVSRFLWPWCALCTVM